MLLASMIIDDIIQHEGANLGTPDSARGQQKFRTGDISRFATLNGDRVILVPEDVELRHRAKGTIRWRSKARSSNFTSDALSEASLVPLPLA
jgi:hypothetical protein